MGQQQRWVYFSAKVVVACVYDPPAVGRHPIGVPGLVRFRDQTGVYFEAEKSRSIAAELVRQWPTLFVLAI
jgi:hypothetical protein